ncbi:MAG: PTS transporter subunit EIIB [Actinomycetaceae bacterium]|nr:PTS transporter subunit EIIB [Actinomycetaceae bacterium]
MNEIDIDKILEALGGVDNISLVEPCVTRLRFEVRERGRVDLARLQPPLCYGATVMGTAVQVIVGPNAEIAVDEIRDRFH